MKDKMGYAPLAVVLGRILLDYIDAPASAQNIGTIDASVLGSWFKTNKLLGENAIDRISLDNIDIDDKYIPLSIIMSKLVFSSKLKNSNRIVRDLMTVGMFLDENGVMSHDEAVRFTEGLADTFTNRLKALDEDSHKTAFDGDIVLKVEE